MSTRAYGWQEELFVAVESAYGVLTFPTGTDAFCVLSTDFQLEHPRMYRADEHSSGRDHISRISGRKKGSFTVLKNVIPSGTPGTYPDGHLLWKSAFGSAASQNGSCVYSLLGGTNQSLTILRVAGHMSEAICGAVVDRVELSTGGGQNARVLFSGYYKDRVLAGSSALAARVASGGVTLGLPAGDACKYSAGARILIGGSENATISSVNTTSDLVVLSAGVASDHATGSWVEPLKPNASTTGQPVYGISGGVVLGGSSLKAISSRISLQNNLQLRNDEYGSDSATGLLHPARRLVTFQHLVHLGVQELAYVRRSEQCVSQAMTHTVGSVPGCRVDVHLPRAQFDVLSPRIPESEEAALTLNGVGLGSSGNDSISVKFY